MNQYIIAFLKMNGFKRMEKNSYANDLCNVGLHQDGYVIANNKGHTMYTYDFTIYPLIGILTYYELMNKNYLIKK